MRKIQNFLPILLVLSLVFALAACQNSNRSTESKQSQPETQETVTQSQPEIQDTATTDESDTKEGQSMIIYFSSTKNTEGIATKLHEQSGIELYQIKPQIPYSDSDLNWHDDNSRANKEQNDDTARPEMSEQAPDLNDIDTIYLGMPLWWGKAPRIIQTFIENTDLTGKTVHVFCTSGSSPIEPAVEKLKATYPDVNWQKAKRFEINASDEEVGLWAEFSGE